MSYPDPRRDGSSYPKTTYFEDAPEATAWLRRADAPAELRTGGGYAHYLATGQATRGQFGLFKWDMEAKAGGPGAHFHRTISESFFVLSGSVRIYDGNDWLETGPGDFVFVPEGGVHGFRNDSDEPASMLILFSPGAPREWYFEGLVEMFKPGNEVSPEEFKEFCERHDNYYL